MKYLIVGMGGIGRTHADALTALGYKDMAFCSSTRARVEKAGEDYGVKNIYTDYHEAILDYKPDAVVVCTPNNLHEDPTVFAMEHGAHVLCEKPMASTAEEARRMQEAAVRTGKKLMIAYIVRTYDALGVTKKILDENRIGKVVSARCVLATPETLTFAKTPYRKTYETGGGIVYDYTHEIDYMRYLMGEPVEGVAFVESAVKSDVTVDDNADILFKCESGATMTIHMDYIQEKGGRGSGRNFEIVGEKGHIYCNFSEVVLTLYDGRVEHYTLVNDWNTNFQKQYIRFEELCAGGNPNHVSGSDGVKIIEIADKLYESARQHKLVRFDD